MNTTHSETLNLKIDLVERISTLLLDGYDGSERYVADTDTMLNVLITYQCFLVQRLHSLPITHTFLPWIKRSIRDAGRLLVSLGQDNPVEMAGWFHGANPVNRVYAVANLLSRIILELREEIGFVGANASRIR